MSPAPEPTVSVVVVTRNEAAHIDECLTSVLELCRSGPAFEVILVDSNSTDDSVARATEYPVTVLRIPSDDLASPGAGRFVGSEHATGEYVLFVDGDMRLETDWLNRALRELDRPDVAGVTGHLNDAAGVSTESPVDALRGVALYDREALDEAGGFDPHLQASEDLDVGFRLAEAGYRLVRLPLVVASHPSHVSLGEPLRRWRQGYFQGAGAAVWKTSDDPRLFRRHLYSMRHSLAAMAWVTVGLVLLATGASRRSVLGWVGFTIAGIGGYAARTGPRQLVVDGSSYLLTALGLAVAARSAGARRESFPLDSVELVQRHEGVP